MNHPERHTGLALLRVLAMVLVVTQHGIGHGGLGASVPCGSLAYCVYYFLFFLCRVCTNCFVLLSGYFLSAGTARPSHLLRLEVQTLFYSLLTFGVALACGVQTLSAGALLRAVTPIFSGSYWFVSCYALLYLAVPLLNRLLSVLDRRTHILLLCGLFVVLSVLPTALFWSTLVSGSDCLWFFALYLLAAYLRRYGIHAAARPCLLVYLGCSAAQAALRVFGQSLSQRLALGPELIDHWGSCEAPLTLAASVALFLLFQDVTLRRPRLQRCVFALASCSLGVYLLHDSPLLRAPLWAWLSLPRFGGALLPSLFLLAGCVLGLTAVGCCVDALYRALYRLLAFPKLEAALDAALPRLAQRLARFLP